MVITKYYCDRCGVEQRNQGNLLGIYVGPAPVITYQSTTLYGGTNNYPHINLDNAKYRAELCESCINKLYTCIDRFKKNE